MAPTSSVWRSLLATAAVALMMAATGSAAPGDLSDMDDIRSNISALWDEVTYLRQEVASHHHSGHDEQDHDRIVMDVGVMQHEHHIHHEHEEGDARLAHPYHHLHHSHDALQHLDGDHSHDIKSIRAKTDEHDEHDLHGEEDPAHDTSHDHAHDDAHDHGNDDAHGHAHEADHSHNDYHSHDHSHDHDADNSHDHGDHEHEDDHTHDHGHDNGHDHGHDHTHDHGHDHSHDYGHDHTHDHEHEDDHTHDHGHDHTHDHGHDHSHDHGHDHSHDHGHDNSHDHENEASEVDVIHVHVVDDSNIPDELHHHHSYIRGHPPGEQHKHHDRHHHNHLRPDHPQHPRNQEGMAMATCAVKPNSGHPTSTVTGNITITQRKEGDGPVYFDLQLEGFDNTLVEPALYGFHVHEIAIPERDCSAAGGHFNPHGTGHGGPTDDVRHVGDLGNIEVSTDGRLSGYLVVDHAMGFSGENNIIGKSIVIHSSQDNLGRGGDAGSLASGKAGPRLACCNIHSGIVPIFRFGG